MLQGPEMAEHERVCELTAVKCPGASAHCHYMLNEKTVVEHLMNIHGLKAYPGKSLLSLLP